jgi:hypothetical protein
MRFNIAGYEIDLSRIEYFDDNDVKESFNGDFGVFGFIQDPSSDYGNGYKYILVELFYKNNIGFVVRAILSNDINLYIDYSSITYFEIYHSFRFKN